MHESSGLAYWTGEQRSQVHVKGKDELVSIDLRVTEGSGKEDGSWMLIHRHADALNEK